MWGLPQGRVIFRCSLSSVQGGVGHYMVRIECDEHNKMDVTKIQWQCWERNNWLTWGGAGKAAQRK